MTDYALVFPAEGKLILLLDQLLIVFFAHVLKRLHTVKKTDKKAREGNMLPAFMYTCILAFTGVCGRQSFAPQGCTG